MDVNFEQTQKKPKKESVSKRNIPLETILFEKQSKVEKIYCMIGFTSLDVHIFNFKIKEQNKTFITAGKIWKVPRIMYKMKKKLSPKKWEP